MTLVTDLSDDRTNLEETPPPEFPGISVDGRRVVNTAVIAYAQQLVSALAAGGLAMLAKETTSKRLFDVRYGSPTDCARLMTLLRDGLTMLIHEAMPASAAFEDSASAAAAALSAEAGPPVVLERGPLVRARLLRLSEREHLLSFTAHDYVFVGWSGAVALRERGVGLLLDADFDIRESATALRTSRGLSPPSRGAHDFIAANFDALAARVDRDAPGGWPAYAGELCSDADLMVVDTFWRERITQFAGGPRNLARARESIERCARVRGSEKSSVSAYLARY